jgi:glycolate oxidase subunit GlcD
MLTDKEVLAALSGILKPEQVLWSAASMRAYDCDAYPVAHAKPQAVAIPETTEEVAKIVRWCVENEIPYVARGAGTGLSGGAIAALGGIVISTKRMTRILEIDIPNRRLKAQSGAVNRNLSQAVASHGLHFAPDPSSQSVSTLGGNIAENSGGPHTLKYGVTAQHILGVTLVTPEGEVVQFQSGVPGYDFVGLIVGSEGTLGIVTEAWVKLIPLPSTVRTALVAFANVRTAVKAVSNIIAAGVTPAALEMIDKGILHALKAAFGLTYHPDAQAVLLIECDGDPASVDREMTEALAICSDALEINVAETETERLRLWTARKKGIGAMGRLAPSIVTHDGVIPRSKLPETLDFIYTLADKKGLNVANIFHAGDGNLHPCFYFDDRDPQQLRSVGEAGEEILRHCVAAGGSITGEHGVGVEKMEFMRVMYSAESLAAQAAAKRIFNSGSLCNPCKVLPDQLGCIELKRGTP